MWLVIKWSALLCPRSIHCVSGLVRKVDNAFHLINPYPADSVVCSVNTYSLDSDLSGERRYSAFEQLGQVFYCRVLILDYYCTCIIMIMIAAQTCHQVCLGEEVVVNLFLRVVSPCDRIPNLLEWGICIKLSLVLKDYLLFTAKASKRSLNDHRSENRRKKQRQTLSNQPSQGKERDSWA